MGIFRSDTEEEKLIKAIKNANIDSYFKERAIEYLDSIIRNERKNDFFDTDFLIRVIIEIVELKKERDFDFDEYLNQLIDQVRIIFPNGIATENYNVLKERFINQYCGIEGYVNIGITSNPNLSSFYMLFPNEEEFFKMIRVIRDTLKKSNKHLDIDDIFTYGIKVSPYCVSYEEKRDEILSFMNGYLNNVVDVDIKEYMEERIDLAQEKCGIYRNINESSLALISSEVQKLEGLVIKLRNQEKRIESYDKKLSQMTKSGIDTIKQAAEASKEELRGIPEQAREELEKEVGRLSKTLDEYLVELEKRLKISSDNVFKELLDSASQKIKEIKSTIQLITTTTDQDLSRIQKQTQESIEELIKMAESNPKLQIALDTVSKHENLQKGLEALANMQGTIPTVTQAEAIPTSKIIVPALEREVVPADPTIIIPSNPTGPVYAFDYKIPINDRKSKIMEELKRRESEGELFHAKTEEIIDCMLEGDWPYLWGPSGCGKTYTVEQVASLLGVPVIENGRITDDYTILGYYDPQGKFRATGTYVAVEYGGLLFLDEMDTGVPETQTNFNPIYSKLVNSIEHPERKYYVKFASDRPTLIHPNFRMISAGNTKGGGENAQFNARLQIDESVQQRMTQIEFKYDNRVEKIIFKDYEAWYNFFVKFRQACDEYANKHGLAVAPGITTTRDAQAIVRYLEHDSKSIETILSQKFIQTKDDTYLNFLRQRFANYYNLDSSETYSNTNRVTASKATEKVLAKKFISECTKRIK